MEIRSCTSLEIAWPDWSLIKNAANTYPRETRGIVPAPGPTQPQACTCDLLGRSARAWQMMTTTRKAIRTRICTHVSYTARTHIRTHIDAPVSV